MVEIFDDIRKIYRFAYPSGELAEWVEFFSESSPRETFRHFGRQSFCVKMFPSWTPTVWVNLSAPYSLETEKGRHSIGRDTDILVVRDHTLSRMVLPVDRIFTVKFYPGSLDAIFGISQRSLLNQIASASHIFPETLLGRLKQEGSFEKKVAMLEQYLLAKLARQRPADHYLKYMRDSAELYVGSGWQYNTSEIAEKLFTHSKSINRYFHRVVGIPPKKYFSSLRARAALTQYLRNKSDFDPTRYGYYDMSHFYKEARQFCGQRMAGN
jgi:AraC-like DNA-binding protein